MEPKRIKLDMFVPREYQETACDAFENKGYRKMVLVWGRRSGKDVVCWNLMIRQAIKKVGVYFYCLPSFNQAKKVIWDSITNEGKRFLDFIPQELIKSINGSELKIILKNDSVIQLIGSDNYNSALVGTNPRFICFSEFGLADGDALKFVMPIINANGGSLIIVSTPRGKNHLFDVYDMAKDSTDWFCQKLSLDDTKHIPVELIQQDIEDGLVSAELVQQEYYCSFEQGHEGAYYARNMDKCKMNGQIDRVPWDPSRLVYTAWDLGLKDYTAIIWYQLVGVKVHVIDCYQNNGHIISHYVGVVLDKPYRYAKHWAPHDISVRDLNTGYSRTEIARQLGLEFEVRENGLSSALPAVGFSSGIDTARATLAITYFDEVKCADLIRSLENYREAKNKYGIGTGKDVHDKYSHFADAFRYLSISLSSCRAENSTAEQLERNYKEACNYGRLDNPYAAKNDFGSIQSKYSNF